MPSPDLSFSVVLAYMGLGSGLDLLPYFAALLSLVGAALIAVVQWPALIVIRWLRAKRKHTLEETADHVTQAGSGPDDDTRAA